MRIKTLLLLLIALTIATALITPAAKLPEKLRILSCDLNALAIQNPTGADKDVATELKRLLDKADPDIVFLQRVTDWETCDRICKLRPGLRVLTCSAFTSEPNSQVAILARDKAVLSWVDEISTGDGFAFALIQAGSRKVGVFSVQTRDAAAGPAATERLVTEVKKLQQFANNRPESFIIAGASLSKTALAESGFETIAPDTQPNTKIVSPEFWSSNAGFLSRPRSLAVAGIARPLLVTDVDTANTFSSKFAYQNALLFPGESPAPVTAVLQPTAAPKHFPTALVISISAIALLLIVMLLRRRKPTMALVAIGDPNLPSNDPALSDPVRLGLLAWVKTIFMQRLIADRRQMIADETEATRRTLAIEQKLTELQIALQDRISGYENRIARLEGELSAATFENRELIRLQITELKDKVAKAKEEFAFRRN